MESKQEKQTRGLAAWDPFSDTIFQRGFPFRELGLPSRLLRLFEPLTGDAGQGARLLAPAVDINETDAAYVVTAELPGVAKDDVTVEVEEGVLTIRGEKRSEREDKKERGRWIERSYGSFSRAFTLPRDAAADHIDASFKDGVLTLRIAKTEASKPKPIAIKG